MIAPVYSSSAPLYDGTGASASTPIATAPGAAVAPSLTGQRVNVVAPNGETISIDVSELATATERGFKVETSEARGIRQYVEENKGASGTLKVAARGLLDEATFGVADVAIDASTDPYQLAKWQALKADHEVANITGRVAGFGASLLYGGEFFGAASKAGGTAAKLLGRGAVDAIEHGAGRAVAAELAYRAPTLAAGEASRAGSGLARKILQSSADFGAQGLVLSSPKAMAQAITGDPERAAETWLYGGVGGAVLGAPMGLVGSLAGRSAPKVLQAAEAEGLKGQAAAKLRAFGDEQAISALNMTKPLAKKLRRIKGMDDAVAITREAGLAEHAGDPAAMAERVTGLWDDAGKAIGEIRKSAGNKDIASFDETFNTLLKPAQEAQKGMGGRAAGENVEKWLNDEILKPLSERWIDSHGAGMAPKSGLSLEELHEVQRVVDKATRWDQTVPAAVNDLRKEVRGAIHGLLESKLDQAGKDLGKELVPAWREANRRYQVLSVMKENAINNVDRGMANSRHGLFGFIGNQVGATAGGFVGGGMGSLVGGALGGEVTNALRRYGPAYLSKGAHAAADMLEGRGMVALEEAFATNARQLDRIPVALEAMAAGKAASKSSAVRETFSVNVMSRFLDTEGGKLDTVGDVMAFSDRLASLASNPQRATELAAEAVEAVRGDAPEVAVAAASKLAQTAMYLYDKAPKPPSLPGPFEPPSTWAPSAVQVRDFKTRVAVAKDPYKAIDALVDGTLTKAHVETLMTLAPRLYEEMVRRVMDHAGSGKAKPLPYAERLRLSMLTGAPLDRSIAQIAGYQQAFSSKHAQPEPRRLGMKAPEVSDVQRVSG